MAHSGTASLIPLRGHFVAGFSVGLLFSPSACLLEMRRLILSHLALAIQNRVTHEQRCNTGQHSSCCGSPDFGRRIILDIMVLFGLGQTTVFLIMWEVIDAINKTPAVGGFFFPQTEAECQLAAGRWEVRYCSSSILMVGDDSDTCGRSGSNRHVLLRSSYTLLSRRSSLCVHACLRVVFSSNGRGYTFLMFRFRENNIMLITGVRAGVYNEQISLT